LAARSRIRSGGRTDSDLSAWLRKGILMRLRTHFCRAGFTVVAAAVALSLGVTNSLAAVPTLRGKVTHGGKTAFHAAKAQLSAQGMKVTCANSGKSVVTGTSVIPTGPRKGSSPLTIGTISAIRFANCSAAHSAVSIKAKDLPYSIKVDSATSRRGKTDAIISGIDISVITRGCELTVSGSASGYYTNSTHTLTVTPKLPVKPADTAHLKISNVRGCASAVSSTRHPQILPVVIAIAGVILVYDIICLFIWFHRHK
jgi:hypothetical protein